MFTINLHNLIFFAHHGIHEEEQLLGNTFVVNVSLAFSGHKHITTLEQTVNYVSVYQLVKQRMMQPTHLLETIAQDIAEHIYQHDKRIISISVAIEKKNPPIKGFEGSIGVKYTKDF